MIGEPMTDWELDEIEDAAHALVLAVEAGDLDSAYIISSTCEKPALLAMFVATVGNG